VILSQGEIVQLCKADGQQVVQRHHALDAAGPCVLHRDGAKVLLSGLAPDALARYLSSVRMKAYTAQTITTRTQLERDLAKVREQGYALDVEELAEDLCCVSVPVRDPNSHSILAAISIAMPKKSLSSQPRATLAQPARRKGRAHFAPAQPDRQLASCWSRPSSSARC
jgi:DNA-binding IclR family transcriptional regulator